MAVRKGVVAATVVGGLVGGACDPWVACTLSGLSLVTIGKAVARGWFDGTPRAAGCRCRPSASSPHFAIVLVFAAVFVAASPQPGAAPAVVRGGTAFMARRSSA